jgi:hypothetical protein
MRLGAETARLRGWLLIKIAATASPILPHPRRQARRHLSPNLLKLRFF